MVELYWETLVALLIYIVLWQLASQALLLQSCILFFFLVRGWVIRKTKKLAKSQFRGRFTGTSPTPRYKYLLYCCCSFYVLSGWDVKHIHQVWWKLNLWEPWSMIEFQNPCRLHTYQCASATLFFSNARCTRHYLCSYKLYLKILSWPHPESMFFSHKTRQIFITQKGFVILYEPQYST